MVRIVAIIALVLVGGALLLDLPLPDSPGRRAGDQESGEPGKVVPPVPGQVSQSALLSARVDELTSALESERTRYARLVAVNGGDAAALRDRLAQEHGTAVALGDKVAGLVRDLDAERIRSTALGGELSQARTAVDRAEDRVRTLERRSAGDRPAGDGTPTVAPDATRADLDAERARSSGLAADLARIRDAAAAKDARMAALDHAVEDERRQSNEARSAVEAAETRSRGLERDVSDLQADLEAERARAAAMVGDIASGKRAASEAEANRDKAVEDAAAARAASGRDMAPFKAALDAEKARAAALAAALGTSKGDVSTAMARVGSLEAEVEAARAKAAEAAAVQERDGDGIALQAARDEAARSRAEAATLRGQLAEARIASAAGEGRPPPANAPGAVPQPPPPTRRPAAVQAPVARTVVAAVPPTALRVLLRYAHGSDAARRRALEVGGRLSAVGLGTGPPEEAARGATVPGVRYFHEADRRAAERVAETIGAPPPVLGRTSDPPPPVGTVEVGLGDRPKGAGE